LATALQHNSTLTTLDLYNNSIGDSGASGLATALSSMCNGLVVALELLVLTNSCTPFPVESVGTDRAQDLILWVCNCLRSRPSEAGSLPALNPVWSPRGFQQRDLKRFVDLNQNKFPPVLLSFIRIPISPCTWPCAPPPLLYLISHLSTLHATRMTPTLHSSPTHP